jgi:hypothetical protein
MSEVPLYVDCGAIRSLGTQMSILSEKCTAASVTLDVNNDG